MKKTKLRFSENTGKQLFIPELYAFSDRAKLLRYIANNPFAQLFTAHHQKLQATSTPLILDPDCNPSKIPEQLTFLGHIAKRNPHCEAINNHSEALAVFVGADAYVSPNWFKNSNTVPTWNFTAIHLRGKFQPIKERHITREVLLKTINHMEVNLQLSGEKQPWRLEQTPRDLVDMLFEHILAFRFIVHSIEGIHRLAQEKDSADRESIIQGLVNSPQRGATEIARLIAQDMVENRLPDKA